jgi:hypothetical protein
MGITVKDRTNYSLRLPHPTQRPIVTSPTNSVNGRLNRRIEADRHDLGRLMMRVGTFPGSQGTEADLRRANTYYRQSGRYLWGLIDEAKAEAKAARLSAASTPPPDDRPFDLFGSGFWGLVDQAKEKGCTVRDAMVLAQLLAEAAGSPPFPLPG